MAANFCERCGEKLDLKSNFCSSCGYSLKKEKPIISMGENSKRKLVNIVIFILIALFSVSFYISFWVMSFRWETVTRVIDNSYNSGETFTIFVLLIVGFLAGVIIISKVFKHIGVSQFFVKLLFITCIVGTVMFILHILHTIFLYFNIEKAIEAFIGYYPENIISAQSYIVENTRTVLESKLQYLMIDLLAVLGFIYIVLNRYFKEQSVRFLEGIKLIYSKPNRAHEMINVFKQLK